MCICAFFHRTRKIGELSSASHETVVEENYFLIFSEKSQRKLNLNKIS